MILLLLNMQRQIFYPFYLNPQSWQNENEIQLVNENCYTTQDRREQKAPLSSPTTFNSFATLV